MDVTSTLEEFLDHHKNGEVIDMNNPKCIGCDDCCTMGAAITKKEYNRILKYLTKDVNGIVLYKRALKTIDDYMKQGTIYFKCPLVVGKRCGIYRIRPQICKDFHCKSELNKLHPENINDDMKKEYKYIMAQLFYDI